MYLIYDSLMKDKGEVLLDEINSAKKKLAELGRMHPGSVSKQKRSHGGQYWQLSYSFAGKGHTLYVREDDIDQVREEVENYREFRSLVNRWIELEIEYSRLRRSGS